MSPHNSDMGPWGQFPGLVQRTADRIDIQIPHDPDAVAYNVWASSTLDGLYGAPTGSGILAGPGRFRLFHVKAGSSYRSATIRQRGWGTADEARRGTTRALFTLADFPALGVAPNSQVYLSIQQVRAGGAVRALAGANIGFDITGPILVCPAAELMGMVESTLAVTGTAADMGAAIGSLPSAFDRSLNGQGAGNGPPMGIVLPRPSTSVTVRNLDDANPMLVSFGWNMPYVRLTAAASGKPEITTFGAVKEIYLSSLTPGGTNPTFMVVANLGLGASGGV